MRDKELTTYRRAYGVTGVISASNFPFAVPSWKIIPALICGNTVVWKPSASAMYSAYWIMKLLEEAGLPPGVINMVHGDPAAIANVVLAHPDMSGVHFTGSTDVFRGLWAKIGANIGSYRNYPRIVGETGGKDFVLVHSSADVEAVAVALVRGAYEYQGQKCSAASRAYIPADLWPQIRRHMQDMIASIEMGSPEDPGNFVNAVIHRVAFDKIGGFIERAKANKSCTILAGGSRDDSKGFFITPTLIECSDPKSETMVSEIFGPVLSIHVYPETKWEETLKLVDDSSAYALTGSIFARDRAAVLRAEKVLENAAGNFYINDKPTGAVVGQQPFGGSRASGTNDKAGSYLNLLRWVSPRTIKETFEPPHDYRYPWLKRSSAAE
jgi:1-pyrroline-5-carboxylate dehydrogenase